VSEDPVYSRTAVASACPVCFDLSRCWFGNRLHPLVGQLNTRDAHGYIHATNKHVGYAYPADMLQQASSLVGGRKSQEQCTDAGRALSKDRSSKGAIMCH
jgi:hypothetical protein